MSRLILVLGALAVILAGCDQAPNPVFFPLPPQPGEKPPQSEFILVAAGQTVSGQLHGFDSHCGALFDPLAGDDPSGGFACQGFEMTVLATGTLTIRVSWEDPDSEMCVLMATPSANPAVAQRGHVCAASPIVANLPVVVGRTALFAVELAGSKSGRVPTADSTEPFTLSTNLHTLIGGDTR